MCVWLLYQDDSFYDVQEQGSIWSILCQELNLTEDQLSRIMEYRSKIRKQRADLDLLIKSLEDLRHSIDLKNRALDREMQEFQKILTPTQVAKV